MMSLVFQLSGGKSGAFAGDSWSFEKGQEWVVTGPNGSGKSYLAALLAGELPPRGLSIEMDEAVEGRVSMMTFSQQQEQASGSWLQARWHDMDDDAIPVSRFLSFESVFEINPFEVREGDGPARRAFAKRLASISATFRLRELMNRGMLQLSNGEMRRVLLSRALLKSPALLVLDDPFAGLDPEMRERLKTALDALAKQGLPMVLMIRNEDEIPSCATHILRLNALHIAGKKPASAALLKAASFPPPKRQNNQPTSSSGKPVIEFNHLSIRYGRRVLLRDFTWTVRQGERWLVIGPNGAGKTTLTSYVTGDNPQAYATDVRVFGEPREPGQSLWKTRSRIGQVSPEIQCYFNQRLNALDAVLSGLCNKDGEQVRITKALRAQAAGALAELGVRDAATKTFSALSAGEQRIILLARALLPQPDLLLLDEPCLNLDGAMRRRVLRVVEHALKARPQMTAICIAHRPEDVPEGFDRTLDLEVYRAKR